MREGFYVLPYRSFFLVSEAANRAEFGGRGKYVSPSLFFRRHRRAYGCQMLVFWRTRFYALKAVAATEDIRCHPCPNWVLT